MPRPMPQQDELLPEEMDYIQSLQSPAQPQPEYQPDEVGDALQAFDAAHAPPPVVDPWEEIAPKAPETPEVAQPFPMEEGSYGPQTAGQMASPEAPVYVPPAPPKAANAKAAYSATDSPNELFGHEAPRRNVDAEMGQLESLIGQRGPGSAPVHDNEASYDADYADSDKRAQIAYVLNYLAGGPEQAYKFQQMYDQKKAQHRAGLAEARTKDQALTQQNAPISDAQAQMLVRVYRISPKAASRMTQGELAKLQPTLNSTGYVGNKDQSTNDKYTIEQWKLLQKELQAQEGNAADTGQAMIKGQNALAAVKANKKGGGGGTAGPRDIIPALTIIEDIQKPEAEEALRKLQAGEPPADATEERAMTVAQGLLQQDAESFAKTHRAALERGALGRSNTAFGADVSVAKQQRDVGDTFKVEDEFNKINQPFVAAYRAAHQLGPQKLAYLAKFANDTTGAVAKQYGLSPEDKRLAAQIRQFVASYAFSQGGKALTASEIQQLSGYTGVPLGDDTTVNSFLQDPQVLMSFLDQMRSSLAKKKGLIKRNYPNAFGGSSGP